MYLLHNRTSKPTRSNEQESLESNTFYTSAGMFYHFVHLRPFAGTEVVIAKLMLLLCFPIVQNHDPLNTFAR